MDSTAVVVDPGPPDPDHLAALTSGPPVELILITHHHIDHVEAAAQLSAQTGAPVRAFLPEHCHGGGTPLVDGERITAAGLEIRVLHTPGHCADSVCFVVDERRRRAHRRHHPRAAAPPSSTISVPTWAPCGGWCEVGSDRPDAWRYRRTAR